jgi:group II intron reverse transcriptase/maturase
MTKKNIKRNNTPSVNVEVTSSPEERLRRAEDGRCTNAFEVLSEPSVLKMAYERMKSNPGNMVPGTDEETLDGISESWFRETSKSLRDETFRPKPSRRIYIPKKNGKLRPIGISSPRDKIIQQSMKLVMESVLDPKFLDSSHGFRPHRGCHTALKEVRSWKGVSWIIEGDIKGFFDSIDHQILAKLIEKHFAEARLMHLYWKFVKAGYVEWETREFVKSALGVPQGSVISPLLSNVILHELDLFLKGLIEERARENAELRPLLVNPMYHRLTMQLARVDKKKLSLKAAGHFLSYQDRQRRKTIIRDRRKVSSLVPNADVVRLKYVRYADDWLVGVWGNKGDAIRLHDNWPCAIPRPTEDQAPAGVDDESLVERVWR